MKWGVYNYGVASGQLFFKSVVPSPGQLPCWLVVNKAGTRLYVAETMTNSITVYDVTNSTAPVQLQHIVLKAGGDFTVTNLALAGDEAFLFAITGDYIHELNVAADGTLTEAHAPRNLPVPAGTVATGMATLLK